MLGILVTAPGSAASQVTASAYFGSIKSSLSGDGPPRAKYTGHNGPVLGLALDFHVRRDVAVSVQPSYSQRGTGVAFRVPGEREYRDSVGVRLDYLSVPLLLKVFAGHTRTFVTGGVDIGYLAQATLEDQGNAEDVSDSFNQWDAAAVFGFGVAILKRKPEVSVELRYVQSLLNIAKSESMPEEISLPVRSRGTGFQLLVAIGLTVGGK